MSRPDARRRAIDWTAARERLERSLQALDDVGRLSPERARQLLEERARALAQPPRAEESEALLHLLVLAYGAERYALEMRWVLEILRDPDVTPIPAAPPFVVGVGSYRGDTLAVFDLQQLLEVPGAEARAGTRLVVLGDERPEFGVLAGAGLDERSVPASAVEALPASLGAAPRPHLRGVLDDATLVVDGGLLLGDRRYFLGGE